ncbi:MAG: hypothetical protein JSV62_14460 [Promethearchaeota archaeon]|nr:MAG: hypothetical protein JSV62_14460 [Candidatus Lokiarchaeota archaeon]
MSNKKALLKKKVPKITEIKKPLIIGGVIFAIAVVGIILGINFYIETTQTGDILYFGVSGLPLTIDPIDATDGVDLDFISQVTEGLFDIDENSEIIGNLAKEYEVSPDGLNITCPLRQGVKFHDGMPFNATAVKWNFDRTYRLIDEIWYSWLWLLPDGRHIINETQKLDDYTVKFILNAPYGPFINLLASVWSNIVSPTATPADRFIGGENDETEYLIGTGPFIIDSFGENNIILSANPHYWGGKPKIDKLIFLELTRSQEKALLSGEVHLVQRAGFNESTLNFFRSNRLFNVSDPIPLPYLETIVMNNKLINYTIRKAISYAINYSNYLYSSAYVNAKGPIPEGILYHNITDINVPYYNLTFARKILKDNLGSKNPQIASLPLDNNSAWEKLTAESPIATYNFSSLMHPKIWGYGVRITEDLKQIGIKVEPINITFTQWLYQAEDIDGDHRNEVELGYNFWYADYNDPSDFINEWFTNKKIGYNMGQVNDTQLQELMEEALIETDPIVRRQLYYQIQKRLIEDVCPHVWLHSWIRWDVHVSNLRGWHPYPYKIMFKSVYFV